MKDLITTIGSIMILMIFVMQFCLNQVITSRILLADKVVDEMDEHKKMDFTMSEIEIYKSKMANVFDCNSSEVTINVEENKAWVKVPIKTVIASGDFLGISDEDNQSVYKREILME